PPGDRAGGDADGPPRVPRRAGGGWRSPARTARWGDRSRRRALAVRRHGGGVAPQTGGTGALERRVAEATLELFWRGGEQSRHLGRSDLGPHGELRVGRRGGEGDVPRAHVLTHVAPEQPVAHHAALVVIERRGVLDREVGDAAPRVEYARLDEGLGGTGVETAAARAATIGLKREIGDELGIGEDHADERERPDGRMDQHG